MRSDQAGRQFMRMIERAQLAPDDFAGHVDVFKRFAAMDVEDVGDERDANDDSDQLLFETLIIQDEGLSWGLTRELYADVEPITMGVEATFDLDDELCKMPQAQAWGGGGAVSAGEFFAEVERLPGWTAAFSRAPRKIEAVSDDGP